MENASANESDSRHREINRKHIQQLNIKHRFWLNQPNTSPNHLYRTHTKMSRIYPKIFVHV